MNVQDTPPPANAPEIPSSPPADDFLNDLDTGGEDAADLDSTPALTGHPDEYDHDRDGALPGSAAPPSKPPPAPAAVAPTKPDEPPPRHVPVAELAAERAKRQELQRRIEELEARQRPPEPQKPAEPPEPDIDYLEDPKGYVDQQVKRAIAKLQEPVEQARTTAEAARQTGEQHQAMQQIQTSINAAESAFQAEHPDYFDALRHARSQRVEELRVFRPEASDEEILNYIRVEELRGAVAMLQAGRNPAQVAYEYAKLRGYKPAAAAPAPNGAPATPTPEEQERLRQQARGLPIGTGPGDLQPGPEQSNVMPEFSAALRERFGRPR